MKLIASALLAATSLVALSAQAQSAAPATPWYAGGSIAYSHYNDPNFGGAIDDSSGTGGKVYGGYSFTPNFALEAGYAALGKAHVNGATRGPGGNTDVKGQGLFLDAVGTLPFSQGFSGLGRVGIVNSKIKAFGMDENSTEWKFGAGVQYDFDPHLGVRGEWERYYFKPVDDKGNTDQYSVGLNYKF